GAGGGSKGDVVVRLQAAPRPHAAASAAKRARRGGVGLMPPQHARPCAPDLKATLLGPQALFIVVVVLPLDRLEALLARCGADAPVRTAIAPRARVDAWGVVDRERGRLDVVEQAGQEPALHLVGLDRLAPLDGALGHPVQAEPEAPRALHPRLREHRVALELIGDRRPGDAHA